MCKNCTCKNNNTDEIKRLLRIRDSLKVLLDNNFQFVHLENTLEDELDIVNDVIKSLTE